MRQVVCIAVAWAAGISFEAGVRGAASSWGVLALVAGVGAALALIARHERGAIAGVLVTAVLAGGAASARVRVSAPWWPMTGEVVAEGVVAGSVERLGDSSRAVVDVRAAWTAGGTAVGVRARMQVAWPAAAAVPLPGDRVRFVGEPRVPRGFRVPGAFDRTAFQRGRGIDFVVSANAPGLVRVDAPPESGLTRWAERVARRLAAPLVVAPEAAARSAREFHGVRDGEGLLAALVLGRRDDVRPVIEEAFRKAGVSHVLSVSGLHLAAVTALIYALARALWLRSALLAARFAAERAAALAATPVAIAYTLVTGADVATVRALLVALVLLSAKALGRRADPLTALAAAALAILAWSPWALYEASFQLSFAAALALVMIAPRLAGAAPGPGRVERTLAWARRLGAASLAAWLVTAPLTAFHFGVLQPAGIVANLVVVPLAELALLPAGLLALAVHAVHHGVGEPLVVAAIWGARGLARLVEAIASVAPIVQVSPPGAVELCGCVAGLAALALVRSLRLAALGLVASVAVAVAAGAVGRAPEREVVVVHFLDVGQGDAAVVFAPGGETWLIDAGGRLFGAAVADGGEDERLRSLAADPGEQAVHRFLRHHRRTRLDLVVITHPHPDHYGGLAALAGQVDLVEVWVSGHEVADRGWRSLLADLEVRGVRVRRPPLGLARDRGGARLFVLAPGAPGAVVTPDPARGVNDDSLVLRLEHAGHAVLFAGDLEREGEAALLATVAPGMLQADVVKVPHHGSRTSSTDAFVAAVAPLHAVISCGVKNRFGFPAPAVVAAWERAGAHVHRTDVAGTVSVTLGRRLAVATFDP